MAASAVARGGGDVAALARRTRRIALQSMLAGMGLSLAATGAAAVGLLPAVWGALLQEGVLLQGDLRHAHPSR
jgi:cation transport ATPase